jgi:hypothetical protein
LEDDEDAMTEKPGDSPCFEWWEEAKRKAEEEEEGRRTRCSRSRRCC